MDFSSFSFKTIALLLVATQLGSILATENPCSCYTLHNISKTWEASRKYCQDAGGNLVSMETEQEYQFINETIQDSNVGKEWFIGLRNDKKVRERIKGWKWTTGYDLTIDKWHKNEPRYNGDCVKMIRFYDSFGVFDDVKCHNPKMFICENKLDQTTCESNFKWCKATHNLTSTNVKSMFTTEGIKIETNTRTTTYKPTTVNTPTTSYSFTPQQSTLKQSPSTTSSAGTDFTTNPKGHVNTHITRSTSQSEKQPKSFPLMTVIIALGTLLAVSVCLLAFACYWKRRNKSTKYRDTNKESKDDKLADLEQPYTNHQDTGNEDTTEGIQLFHQNSKPYVTYAVIHNNLTQPNDHNQEPTTSNEPAYASVDDTKGTKRTNGKKKDPGAGIGTASIGKTNDENFGSSNEEEEKGNKKEVVYATVDNNKKNGASGELTANNTKNDATDGKQWPAGQQVVYASVDKSTKRKAGNKTEDVVYAEVGSKENKDKRQSSQITYAELADFSHNGPHAATKPAPYQPAEYAVIIGQKEES